MTQARYPVLRGSPHPSPVQERKALQSPRSLAPAVPTPRQRGHRDQREAPPRLRSAGPSPHSPLLPIRGAVPDSKSLPSGRKLRCSNGRRTSQHS
jgi:hypothetical protein